MSQSPPVSARLPGCSATGVGSVPGTEPLGAITAVLETFADLPYLPELPGRGVGADAVGRSAGLLVDLPVELVAGRWQVAARPGADLATARRLLHDDMGALQVAAHGYAGLLKVSALGPVSLAAALDRSRGEVALSDPGLRRDLTASLSDGLRDVLAQVRSRLPGVVGVLQLDEPSLPAVLAGSLRTRSGWGNLAPLEAHEAQLMLADVLASAPGPTVVHCCAADVPVSLLAASGAHALSFDLDLVGSADLDAYGQAVDAGVSLVVGAVPTTRPMSGAQAADRVATFWGRLGFSARTMREQTVVSPSCGLATLSTTAAEQVSAAAVEAATRLAEQDSVGRAG